ncbi:MAG TPA: DUF1802 family protein [Leptolyngbyaceae cyanobacterium]
MITTALRLPAPDVEALIQGRTIVAISPIFLNPGRLFALYSSDALTISLPVDRYYRSTFLSIAQKSFTDLNSQTVSIKAWARCEFCRGIKDPQALAAISRLTVWTEEALQEILSQKSNIILAYLRVYQLLQPFEVPTNSQSPFVPLQQPLPTTESLQIFGDQAFSQRRRQLENLEAPLHSELEELQSAIAQLATTNPDANKLNEHIKIFLGWSVEKPSKQLNKDLAWINDISKFGNRSIEEDTGEKSNYQAGTDFENITRRSLEFLGFKVDEAYKGGAGGLDLFCSKPYHLVGECKAGKSIPDRTVEELDRIGKRHLKEDYLKASRLIIGPGEPTKNLRESAKISKVSIIKPMTLQKLVELQAKYPGSVNLIELEPYLQAGQSDSRIDEYIEKVLKSIKLRSHIVRLVEKHLEKTGDKDVAVDALHVAYVYSNPPQQLQVEQLREILIELSSPLTGYLGREKKNGVDRFYYLRDLIIENI